MNIHENDSLWVFLPLDQEVLWETDQVTQDAETVADTDVDHTQRDGDAGHLVQHLVSH